MQKLYHVHLATSGNQSTRYSTVRIKPITKKEEQEVPGPAHYQIKEKPFKTKYPNLTSTFASVTSRVVEPPPTVKVA